MSNILKMAALGAGGSTSNASLISILSSLNLTLDLKVSLDAGDINSYNSSVQTTKWLDVSGGQNDFFRGTSAIGDAAQPTFNGTLGGLTAAEFFSFDGGDYFLYDAGTEAWIESMHKDNAILSCIAVLRPVGATTYQRVFSTINAGNPGVCLAQNTAGKLEFQSRYAGGTALLATSTDSLVNAAWNVVGVSVNETTGIGLLLVNGVVFPFTSTYTTPTTSAASGVLALGSNGSGTLPNPSTSRLACLAIWSGGTALTTTNLTDIHNNIKGRFGL